jgi:hypothetical protein
MSDIIDDYIKLIREMRRTQDIVSSAVNALERDDIHAKFLVIPALKNAVTRIMEHGMFLEHLETDCAPRAVQVAIMPTEEGFGIPENEMTLTNLMDAVSLLHHMQHCSRPICCGSHSYQVDVFLRKMKGIPARPRPATPGTDDPCLQRKIDKEISYKK